MCILRRIAHKLSKTRVVRRSLHIDKIHKNNNSFLFIPTLSSKSYFCRHNCTCRSRRKENSSEIPADGFCRSLKLFLRPIKLCEISKMMRSWNFNALGLISFDNPYMSHVMRKPVNAICEQQRRRSACASAQSD